MLIIEPNGLAAAAAILLSVALRGIGKGSLPIMIDAASCGASVGVYGPFRSESSVNIDAAPSVSPSVSKYEDEAEDGDGVCAAAAA
jgi:hypothetical protein